MDKILDILRNLAVITLFNNKLLYVNDIFLTDVPPKLAQNLVM